MTLDLDALEAIARQATPGPWMVFDDDDPFWVWTSDYETYVCSCWVAPGEDRESAKHDATHIATFDPPTVLALIERVKGLHRRRL